MIRLNLFGQNLLLLVLIAFVFGNDTMCHLPSGDCGSQDECPESGEDTPANKPGMVGVTPPLLPKCLEYICSF